MITVTMSLNGFGLMKNFHIKCESANEAATQMTKPKANNVQCTRKIFKAEAKIERGRQDINPQLTLVHPFSLFLFRCVFCLSFSCVSAIFSPLFHKSHRIRLMSILVGISESMTNIQIGIPIFFYEKSARCYDFSISSIWKICGFTVIWISIVCLVFLNIHRNVDK